MLSPGLQKGLNIKSEAVNRLLERISRFIDIGEWKNAEDIIEKLIVAKPWDKKLLLSKANLRKRMWIKSDCEDTVLLVEAIHLFSRCHLLTGIPEAGINTATLLLIRGRSEEAYEKADDTADYCRKLILEEDQMQEERFAAIIAEANLIKGRYVSAESWYKTAAAQKNPVSKQVRENVNLLLKHLAPESKTEAKIRKAMGA